MSWFILLFLWAYFAGVSTYYFVQQDELRDIKMNFSNKEVLVLPLLMLVVWPWVHYAVWKYDH